MAPRDLFPASEPVFVLVVEDNMDAADSLMRFLRVGAGHIVRVAYDEAIGLKLAAADKPDVIVCDIAMPKLNGLELAQQVSKHDPRPLLIALTGHADQFSEDAAKASGFDYYLAKPADPIVVAALIENHRRTAHG
jgi:DNA-binding response OmpR family regulator